MTRQIRFSRQIERFRAALKSKSTVCTKNKIMHFLQSQDSTSSHLQLFGRVSSLSSQLILHFGKTNDWESKWLNIVVSPVCNRHMRREVCQSFVHCWCPSISTATSRHHSKQHTSYAIAVCSYTYLLWRGYPQKMFYIAQMALCSLKLSKMDKNNHKGQKWSPKRRWKLCNQLFEDTQYSTGKIDPATGWKRRIFCTTWIWCGFDFSLLLTIW